jgi:hypothetical protein
MTHIELRTKVGPDVVLTLSEPVGMAEANREVKVVAESVAPALKKASEMTQEEWRRFIAETEGSWRGELERPVQGEFETSGNLLGHCASALATLVRIASEVDIRALLDGLNLNRNRLQTGTTWLTLRDSDR